MTERLEVMEQVVSCEACPLHAKFSGPVFMSGPAPARIAVVGEAPGRQEDEQGAPFVGPAGQVMRRMLGEAGIDPDTVAFVNTVSCFPDGTPEWENVHACADNKAAQLGLVNPEYVLAVGKVALKGFRRELDLKHGRGRPWRQDGRIVFATYHPAAALRNGNYEEAMARDLETFKQMLDSGDWQKFVPLECAGCTSVECVWIEETHLGWCETHLPDTERPLWEASLARAAAEYEAAKARLP